MLFLFFLLGLFSGLLGGLLGIGGGVITVPFLYYLFAGSDKGMQMAISTSLASAFITSFVASIFQFQKKAIFYSALKWMIPTLVIGCIGGVFLAHFLESKTLRLFFGIMAIFLGLYFFFSKGKVIFIAPSPNFTLAFFSLWIGFLSSLLGIGGGSLAFPLLLGYKLPAPNASATSSATTAVTTLMGSLTFLFISWHEPNLSSSFGYIQLPAFFAISTGALLSTFFGVQLSHTLAVSHLKRIFGLCLSLVGLWMLH